MLVQEFHHQGHLCEADRSYWNPALLLHAPNQKADPLPKQAVSLLLDPEDDV